MYYLFRLQLLALPLALLTGCAMENTATSGMVPGTAISGVAFGGQQAIGGAKVYLLAANPAGYGSASLSLLTSASTLSTVDSIGAYGTTLPVTGGFNLAGDYDCTVGYAQGANTSSGGTTLLGDEQVYLYVLGGNPGVSTNKSSGLLAALGPCNAIYSTKITINELTTVAAAYAFAGYATDATHLSSSGTLLARTGLANAGLNSANLVSIATGLPVASGNGITRPVATLYTLADILAACVNGASSNSGCTTLFNYTNSTGTTGTAPTDTATAAINLAHNPWPTAGGMTAIYGLVPAIGAPFSGGLSSQPNDFTLGLQYSGAGVANPTSIAIDASGNAWATNGGANSVSKFSSTGAPISPSAGYTGGGLTIPSAIAIDASGDVWVANHYNSISELSSNGSPISADGYGGGGLNIPAAIAIDAPGNIWVGNSSSTYVSKFSSGGTPVTPNGFSGGGINDPVSIAIDASGNVWTANYGHNSVSEINSSGGALSPATGYTGGGMSDSEGIAIDNAGAAWTANYLDNSVSKVGLVCVRSGLGIVCNTEVVSPSTGYTGGGLSQPCSTAIDSSGNVWVANCTSANSVSKLSGAGSAISPSTGYTGGAMNYPVAVAIDGSGDVWVANASNDSFTELIGAATPVVTPIVANLISPYSAPASKP
jgi:hypothetical protein